MRKSTLAFDHGNLCTQMHVTCNTVGAYLLNLPPLNMLSSPSSVCKQHIYSNTSTKNYHRLCTLSLTKYTMMVKVRTIFIFLQSHNLLC